MRKIQPHTYCNYDRSRGGIRVTEVASASLKSFTTETQRHREQKIELQFANPFSFSNYRESGFRGSLCPCVK
jgi:hypothetical protein